MVDTYKPGELFVYVNGERWELGMVKRPNNTGDGYFCWYSRGDTASNTPTRCMHKLANAGYTHIEQMLDNARPTTCKNVSYYIDATRFECSRCGWNGWVRNASTGRDELPSHCPSCGAKVEVVDE